MPASNSATIRALYRYPVKGLSAERLNTVALARHATFPNDRAFALENGPSGFDPAAPKWQPKIKFLCLMKNARLAALDTEFDDEREILTIHRGGKPVLQESLATGEGRRAVENFFETFMDDEKRGPIRLLRAPDHSFSDLAKKVVSFINLATVAALEGRIGRPVHPLRFRGNVYFEGLPAWSEHDLAGKEIEAGGTRLRVVKSTTRCAATDVDPETALRDMDIPETLLHMNDNTNLGIYAEVIEPGKIAEGDPLRIR